jgi:hypothetical protein
VARCWIREYDLLMVCLSQYPCGNMIIQAACRNLIGEDVVCVMLCNQMTTCVMNYL